MLPKRYPNFQNLFFSGVSFLPVFMIPKRFVGEGCCGKDEFPRGRLWVRADGSVYFSEFSPATAKLISLRG